MKYGCGFFPKLFMKRDNAIIRQVIPVFVR